MVTSTYLLKEEFYEPNLAVDKSAPTAGAVRGAVALRLRRKLNAFANRQERPFLYVAVPVFAHGHGRNWSSVPRWFV